MKSFSFVVLVLLLPSFSSAAEPVDLGLGLTYLRINSVTKSADDLRAALLRPTPVVLDLRYPADEPTAVEILQVFQRQPAKARLYVLVSPSTPPAIAGVFATIPTLVVTLGVKDSRPAPQVVVAQTAEADRAAYAALESGTTLAQLISGKIEKERFDEATLVHEFKTGNQGGRPPAPASEAGPKPDGATPPASVPVTDRVLQRAMHLHRAMQALKRG